MSDKFSVLVICTGNSCRSQMAEGLVKHFMGDRVNVESAGVIQSYVHLYAIQAMSEMDIDISTHKSQHVDEFAGMDFELVVTLCDYAKEVCGMFPWAVEQVHMMFDDPISTLGTREDVMDAFRRTRDEIRRKLLPFIEERYKDWKVRKEKGN